MNTRHWFAGIACLVVGVVVALVLGPVGVSLEVFHDPELLQLRGSRVALAVVVGAALSAVGASLQALLRNPLADPFVLGVSGGAAMGAALLLALGSVVVGAVGFAGAALTMSGALLGALFASVVLLAFLRLERHDGGGDSAILVGVVINAFSWAIVAVVRVVLPAGEAANLSVWLIGALDYPSTPSLLLAAIVTMLGVLLLAREEGALSVLRGGDDDAARLGIDVAAVRFRVVLVGSALVGVAVATTGVIGFVGLLVPHGVRRVFVDNDRAVIPLSALVGAGVLAALDGVARGVFALVGSELPVGAICALVGAPALALMLVREAHGHR